MASFDFYFDYSCPYAYLASTQVEALAARAKATVVYKPMLLGGVFRANGTPQKLFATLGEAKTRHQALDMQRWADLFGVTLVMPAGHPFRTVEALRATLLVGSDPKVIHGFYAAYWTEGRPPSDEATMRDVLSRAGHDARAVMARLDEAKDELRARTDEAVRIGIFGAPAFVVNGQLFWGQDRMRFVEKALAGWKV